MNSLNLNAPKKKKGDVSITMLIFIALGLVVLVVIIAIFMGKIKFMNNNSPDACTTCATWNPTTEGADSYESVCADSASFKLVTSNCPSSPKDKNGKVGTGVCCKSLG